MEFERNINKIGTGLGIILSNDMIRYMELEYNTPITITVEDTDTGNKRLIITKRVV